MLTELFEAISAQAAKADKPNIEALQITGDHMTQYYLIDGEVRDFPIAPSLRAYSPETLEDLIKLAKNLGNSGSIWHYQTAVVLLFDDEDRRERATFVLCHSAQFRLLAKLEGSHENGIDQRSFVKMLRFDLGCNSGQIEPWRKLDWRNEAASEGTVLHGHDKMGTAINAEVQGTVDLPDKMTLSIPLYRNPGERTLHPIECGIDVDPRPDRQKIALIPLPGQLDQALADHQVGIQQTLDSALGEKNIPVYYGSPNRLIDPNQTTN